MSAFVGSTISSSKIPAIIVTVLISTMLLTNCGGYGGALRPPVFRDRFVRFRVFADFNHNQITTISAALIRKTQAKASETNETVTEDRGTQSAPVAPAGVVRRDGAPSARPEKGKEV